MKHNLLKDIEKIKKDIEELKQKEVKQKRKPKDPKLIDKKDVEKPLITQSIRSGYLVLTDSAGNKLSVNLGTNWIGYYDKCLDCWTELIYSGNYWSSMSGESYLVDEIPLPTLKALIKALLQTYYGKNMLRKDKV